VKLKSELHELQNASAKRHIERTAELVRDRLSFTDSALRKPFDFESNCCHISAWPKQK
jgi:hypothetical protein